MLNLLGRLGTGKRASQGSVTPPQNQEATRPSEPPPASLYAVPTQQPAAVAALPPTSGKSPNSHGRPPSSRPPTATHPPSSSPPIPPQATIPSPPTACCPVHAASASPAPTPQARTADGKPQPPQYFSMCTCCSRKDGGGTKTSIKGYGGNFSIINWEAKPDEDDANGGGGEGGGNESVIDTFSGVEPRRAATLNESSSSQHHQYSGTSTLGEALGADTSSGKNSNLRFDRQRLVVERSLEGINTIDQYYKFSSGQLGKGSYGAVCKARDRRSGAIRAVKIIKKAKIENITRLKREISIMKKLDHPHIIKLFEVFENEDDIFLVMELCMGGELFERIIKAGHFSETAAAIVMQQMLSAIRYCHEHHILHRDLKPENLLYVDDSEDAALKIIDWGFAAMCKDHQNFFSTVGTPYYVAPQVLLGNYDRGCDLWSAGVILYILVSGYPPFHGKNNSEILRKVKVGRYDFDPRFWKHASESVKDLIRHLLEFDPSKRYSASEALNHPWMTEMLAKQKRRSSIIPPPRLSINIMKRHPPRTDSGSASPEEQQDGEGGENGDALDKASREHEEGLLRNIKKFHHQNALKKLAFTVIAWQLTQKQVIELQAFFHRLDLNGDGVLSPEELRQGFENVEMGVPENFDVMVQQIDTNHSGKVDYTEFIAATLSSSMHLQEESCRAAFHVFDLNGDGKITKDEIKKILGSQYASSSSSNSTTGGPGILNLDREASVEELIRQVDLNEDGSVDFDEFMAMLKQPDGEGESPLKRRS